MARRKAAPESPNRYEGCVFPPPPSIAPEPPSPSVVPPVQAPQPQALPASPPAPTPATEPPSPVSVGAESIEPKKKKGGNIPIAERFGEPKGAPYFGVTKAWFRAVVQARLPQTEYTILWYLALTRLRYRYRPEKGEAKPVLRTIPTTLLGIVRETHISRKTVWRAIHQLEAAGIISELKVNRHGNGGTIWRIASAEEILRLVATAEVQSEESTPRVQNEHEQDIGRCHGDTDQPEIGRCHGDTDQEFGRCHGDTTEQKDRCHGDTYRRCHGDTDQNAPSTSNPLSNRQVSGFSASRGRREIVRKSDTEGRRRNPSEKDTEYIRRNGAEVFSHFPHIEEYPLSSRLTGLGKKKINGEDKLDTRILSIVNLTPPIRKSIEVGILNARAVRRILVPGDPAQAPLWFGTGLAPDPKTVAPFLESLVEEGFDPVLWCGLAPWIADDQEILSFGELVSPSMFWLLREIISAHSPEALWKLVSRPGIPGALELAAAAFPEGGGRARKRVGGLNSATEKGLYLKWVAWLIDAHERIVAFGPKDYWDARYAAWTDYGAQLARKAPARGTRYPSIWDLIDKTPDPLTSPNVHVRPKEPLHRFLGIADSIPIEWVPAGFRCNFQHAAMSVSDGSRFSVKLTGTFADIDSVDGGFYHTVNGHLFRAAFHYRQEYLLKITPANFAEFAALFPSEQALRHWWFEKEPMRGAPPLEIYQKFGSSPAAVDAEGRWMNKTVEWRKAL